MNGSKSLATLWLVFLLCFGPSMAAPRCRPGSMGCRYNIGRSEIPTTVLGNQLALRSSFTADDEMFQNFEEGTYNVQGDKYEIQRKESKLDQEMDNIF